MLKSDLLFALFVLLMSISLFHLTLPIYAQSKSQSIADNSPEKMTSVKGESVVSVSSSVTVQVSNESLKTKEGMLRSSVIGFLNSGPNVLKTPDSNQPNVKSNIANKINNVTQSVEGIEATNAIIGVELSKALKTAVSSSDKPNQTAIITIETSSTCKPSTVISVFCVNTVTIK